MLSTLILLTSLTAYDFGPTARFCDYITAHDVCVVQASAIDYTQEEVEIIEAIVMAQAGAEFNILEGLTVMFVDEIAGPNVLGMYIPEYNLIRVRPINACLARTALAHEYTHAIEYRLKQPDGINLDHDDPFFWSGYHRNAISQPWGVAVKSAIIAADLLCR